MWIDIRVAEGWDYRDHAYTGLKKERTVTLRFYNADSILHQRRPFNFACLWVDRD